MEIIRYGVSREDLYNLLRMIGVLRSQERVIAVSGVDAVQGSRDLVIVTVSTAAAPRSPVRATLTDRELQKRLAELHAMREAASQDLHRIEQETAAVTSELRQRQIDERSGDEGIPDIVAMKIRSQIRDLLSGGTTGDGKER